MRERVAEGEEVRRETTGRVEVDGTGKEGCRKVTGS